MQGLLQRRLVLLLGDVVQILHAPQHVLLAQLGPFRIDHRVVGRGSLGQPGEHGGFGEVQLRQGPAEIGLRGRGEAVGALPEINLVDVEFENLVLGQIVLDLHRQQGLAELAREGLFAGQEEVAGHLHGDRAGAFPRAPEIGEDGAGNAGIVHSAMVVECVVLRRQDRLPHRRRNCLDVHQGAPFLAELADQGASVV